MLETVMMTIIWYAAVLWLVRHLVAPVDDELKVKQKASEYREF